MIVIHVCSGWNFGLSLRETHARYRHVQCRTPAIALSVQLLLHAQCAPSGYTCSLELYSYFSVLTLLRRLVWALQEAKMHLLPCMLHLQLNLSWKSCTLDFVFPRTPRPRCAGPVSFLCIVGLSAGGIRHVCVYLSFTRISLQQRIKTKRWKLQSKCNATISWITILESLLCCVVMAWFAHLDARCERSEIKRRPNWPPRTAFQQDSCVCTTDQAATRVKHDNETVES